MKEVPARLFLIPAHAAPRCVIVRRKPSKHWHIMLWHTDTDEIEHGSWFRGTLYPDRMDVSWDGRFLIYLAASTRNWEAWTGICEPPWLKTLIHWENTGVYAGGGYFDGAAHLQISDLHNLGSRSPIGESFPFKATVFRPEDSDNGYGVLTQRLSRDGWRHGYWQPTPKHPELSSRQVRQEWAFALSSNVALLRGAQWATWDSLGQLLVARSGSIERYTLEDLAGEPARPSFSRDLNDLKPPTKPEGLIASNP